LWEGMIYIVQRLDFMLVKTSIGLHCKDLFVSLVS
jgi:hypothetical protein